MPAFTDATAERGILRSLQDNPALVWRLDDIVKPFMFHEGRDQIYAELQRIAQAEQPIPNRTDDLPAADPIAAATSVRDQYVLAILDTGMESLGRHVAQGEKGNLSPADILTAFEAFITHARQVHAPNAARLISAADLLGGVLDEAQKRAEHFAATGSSIMGLRTGFPGLDDKLNGLEPGLLVLAGRPGMGKTTLANLIGANVAATGVPTLYVTYENSRDNLLLKHLCRLAGEPETDARRGTANVAALAQAAQRFAPTAAALYYVEASADTTIDTIKAQALQIKHRHKAKQMLVVVDYLQKLAHTGGFDEMRANVGAITAKLRDLSRVLESPVLALASLNRKGYENEETEPELSDLKESGDIEYGADVVAFLWKGKQVGPPSKIAKPVNLSIKKNRGGVSGIAVPLIFKPATGDFKEQDTYSTIGMNGRH